MGTINMAVVDNSVTPQIRSSFGLKMEIEAV
jgi:hypothetical protein